MADRDRSGQIVMVVEVLTPNLGHEGGARTMAARWWVGASGAHERLALKAGLAGHQRPRQ